MNNQYIGFEHFIPPSLSLYWDLVSLPLSLSHTHYNSHSLSTHSTSFFLLAFPFLSLSLSSFLSIALISLKTAINCEWHMWSSITVRGEERSLRADLLLFNKGVDVGGGGRYFVVETVHLLLDCHRDPVCVCVCVWNERMKSIIKFKTKNIQRKVHSHTPRQEEHHHQNGQVLAKQIIQDIKRPTERREAGQKVRKEEGMGEGG